MDEKNTQALQEAKTNELGTIATVEEKPKKKKTNLITPIISIVLGGIAWISTVVTNQFENFQNLIKVFTGNQEAIKNTSELGEASGSFLGNIIQNYGFIILIVLLLLVFTIIGIVGVCKLITRICRRTKNKFTKD